MKRVVLNYLVIATITFSATLMSCDKSDYKDPQNLIGRWAHPMYADNAEGKAIIFYERTNKLPVDSNGIEFIKNGSLIERKNAGWCGTPPVTYSNYSGNWHTQNENIIITVDYWGGMEHRIWKIIDVTETTLKIEVILQEYDNK